MSEIHVVRESRAYPDRLRAYRVILDGEEVGLVQNGESLTVSTEPGRHRLHLVIDYCRSQYADLDIVEGETVQVRCWPNARWFNFPFFLTLGRARYIGLNA